MQLRKPLPKLIVISGASGSGKSTIVSILREVVRPAVIHDLPSTMTREPREEDGNAYRHITQEDFKERERAGKFLWTVEVHGHFYGAERAVYEEAFADNETYVSIIVPERLKQIADVAKEMGVEEEKIVFMHVLSPGEEVLRKRLMDRGSDLEFLEMRIAECKQWDEYVRGLGLPVIFVTNTGSLDDLRREIAARFV